MGKEENGNNSDKSLKTAKELAVERLSADNRKWLAGWEKDGWAVELVDLEWHASKLFEGDTEKHIIAGFSSVVLLLTEIERIESDRKKADDVPETGEPNEKVEPQIVIRNCRVDLDDDEVRQRNEQMLAAMDGVDDAVREFASVKDTHKAIIKSLEARFQELRHIVNSRAEWRNVECKEVFNYENWTVTIVRSDTGEVIEKRPMSPKERQSKLF